MREPRPSKYANIVARRITCPTCGKLNTRVSGKGVILSHTGWKGRMNCPAIGQPVKEGA